MPCTTVTVQAPERQVSDASIRDLTGSGGENTASLEYNIRNPNSFAVTVTVEHIVEGSSLETVDINVNSNSSETNSFSASFNFGDGSGTHDVSMCANHVRTQEA